MQLCVPHRVTEERTVHRDTRLQRFGWWCLARAKVELGRMMQHKSRVELGVIYVQVYLTARGAALDDWTSAEIV